VSFRDRALVAGALITMALGPLAILVLHPEPTPPEMMTPAEVAAHHDLNDRRTSCAACCGQQAYRIGVGYQQHPPIDSPMCWCRSPVGTVYTAPTLCQAVLP
jgi:hypothetical protein